MLFVGCEVPDWIGRFLLRMTSQDRLAKQDKQFFFVNSSASDEPALSSFFATYCRAARVQQLKNKIGADRVRCRIARTLGQAEPGKATASVRFPRPP